MAKKQVSVRLEEEVARALQIYAIENKTSVQAILESYVLKLLEGKGTTKSPSSP